MTLYCDYNYETESHEDFVYSQKLEQQILKVFQTTENSLILKKNLMQKFLFASQDHVALKRALPKCMLHITKCLRGLLEITQKNSFLIKFFGECWINKVKRILSLKPLQSLNTLWISMKAIKDAYFHKNLRSWSLLLVGKPMELAVRRIHCRTHCIIASGFFNQASFLNVVIQLKPSTFSPKFCENLKY